MIYLFLAPGFEEVEALCPLDLLRRAGLEVATVAIGDAEHSAMLNYSSARGMATVNLGDIGRAVTGAHGITVTADLSEVAFKGMLTDEFAPEMLILPGGMPGTTHLDASPIVDKALELTRDKNTYLAAICAAPLVLGKRGFLRGKCATCYPGFEAYLEGASVGGKVIRDGRIITAAGMGVAQAFGLELISVLVSPEKAGEIRASIQAP